MRFYKNPFGYWYWKWDAWHRQNRFRFVYAVLFWQLYHTGMSAFYCKNGKFLLLASVSNPVLLVKERMHDNWLYRIGHISSEWSSPHNNVRYPADRKKCYVRYSNFHQMRKNKRMCMMHLNWWCRDQNMRKYFQMRKKHGIRPGISGFYHDKIQKETQEKNDKFMALKASR